MPFPREWVDLDLCSLYVFLQHRTSQVPTNSPVGAPQSLAGGGCLAGCITMSGVLVPPW